MTKINPDYEQLVKLGLPRLPKNYSYKFYIKDYTHMKEGYTTIVEKKMKKALHCIIRKHFLGIPFYVVGAFFDADEMRRYYSEENTTIRNRNTAIGAELTYTSWHPTHLALLGEEAHKYWEKKIAKKAKAALDKANAEQRTKEATEDVTRFLNKKMP